MEACVTDANDELRFKVATFCRILGMLGLVRDSTGHVSARIPGTDEMWIRCRGGDEFGLMFTDLHNVRRVDFDGKGPGMGDEHGAPHETPIHGEIYRAHPEVQAVVHAHPYYALLCGVTGIQYRPIFGAYEPAALDVILKGVPVFPRSQSVMNKALAAEMLASMGDRDVLLMKGHGITVSGASVEAATTMAIRFDRTSRIMWDIARSGLRADEIPQDDIDRYRRVPGEPRRPREGWQALDGADTWGWKHYVRLLKVKGIGLPEGD
jgi:ribulose-5-phosphate 4-epimerase/fuculose-1-phosphate aldolase